MFGQQNAARLSRFIWKERASIVPENRERCHRETLQAVLFILDSCLPSFVSSALSLFSLPGNILYCAALSNIAGGGLVSLQRFHSSPPPHRWIQTFSAHSRSVGRGCWPEEIAALLAFWPCLKRRAFNERPLITVHALSHDISFERSQRFAPWAVGLFVSADLFVCSDYDH